MTRFLLIRHATVPNLGRTLNGRSRGTHLDGGGQAEVRALIHLLSDVPLSAVAAGPLERTLETARPVAEAHGLDVEVSDAFHEVDFGDWTGLSFDELSGRPEWEQWNRFRSSARPPGGESMVDVLSRALAGVHDLAARYEGGRVAVVTHSDVIRPLLGHFLGMPLDHLLRLEASTASVSTVELAPWGARVLEVNRTALPWWSE